MQATSITLSPKAAASVQDYLARSHTNCIAIGIVFNGQRVGYYLSDGVTLTSRFDIGSISKTFTAQAVLALAAEGRLSLDDTVDRYLPLHRGNYPTILQLLTHTAGYDHLTPVEITVPRLLAKGYSFANLYRRVDEKDVLAALSKRNRTLPHNRYGYSDFAYAILAMVAQRAAEKPFAALMNERIREEYGLYNTEAYPTAPRVATYWGQKPLNAWEWNGENPYIAGGGVVSTIEDMVKYARIQLQSDAPAVRNAQTVHLPSFSPKSNIGTCWGWHTYRRSNQCWHVGGVGTFRSSMIFNRRRSCAVVVLGNAKGGRSANVHYIAKLLYSEIKKKRIAFSL